MKPRNTLVSNDAIRYTARVFAVLSYYKCIDDREDERLKKLAIDEAKKRQEAAKSRNNNQNSGMGLGGMGGGLGGGLGGLGGGGGAGGLRSNTNTGSMAGGMGNLRR